jgi:hypothetical protein
MKDLPGTESRLIGDIPGRFTRMFRGIVIFFADWTMRVLEKPIVQFTASRWIDMRRGMSRTDFIRGRINLYYTIHKVNT